MTADTPKPPRSRGFNFRDYLTAAFPGLLVTALLLALHMWSPAPVRQVGYLMFDAYQRWAPREYIPTPVRIVDIDEETLQRLGQWPWPRTEVAELTQRLFDAGAAVVAFDIVFAEPDRTSPRRIAQVLRANPAARSNFTEVESLADHDAVLADTFANGNAVLGFFFGNAPNATPLPSKAGFAFAGTTPLEAMPAYRGVTAPLPELVEAAAGAGFVTVGGEGDTVIRAAPLVSRRGEDVAASLAVEALRAAQGAGSITVKSSDASGEYGETGAATVVGLRIGDFEAPTTRNGALLMHYTREVPERLVPAWRIMTGDLGAGGMAELFEGHIVFVGAGAQGLRDLVSTPIRDRELGVVVHAQVVEQILHQDFLYRPDWWRGVERSLIVLLGVAIAFSLPRVPALIGGVIVVAGVVAALAGSWLAFLKGGLLLDPTFLVLGVALPHGVGTVVSFYREERRRAYIRSAFDRYLSPELVARIARDPGQLELGGEERDMTVMFCDIRSFSRISETLTPRQIIGFLIDFLTPMTDILIARKATIDKYIGDAILAFWNAPLNDPDHPRNAALGVLEMIERLETLNAEMTAAPGKVWPGEVKIGVGLNTGPCCVGNMGSARRLNYSLIGDTVNLASRIEGMTKLYGVAIAVGAEMAARIPDFALIEVDRVRVVGRDTPETLFALLGRPQMAQDEAFIVAKAAWQRVLAAYRGQDWDGALAALQDFETRAGAFGLQKLAALYRARIAACRADPPGAGWDGVFQATEK